MTGTFPTTLEIDSMPGVEYEVEVAYEWYEDENRMVMLTVTSEAFVFKPSLLTDAQRTSLIDQARLDCVRRRAEDREAKLIDRQRDMAKWEDAYDRSRDR